MFQFARNPASCFVAERGSHKTEEKEKGHSYQATSVDAISQISPLEIKGSLDTFKTHLKYLLRL